MNEFERIEKFFKPLARGHQGALGLRDDAALLDVPEGCEMVVSADMSVEGVHFRKEDEPGNVACKTLRVNLSDIAAKGAKPLGYFLSLCWPERLGESGMKVFAEGLARDGDVFDIPLLGGDLTAGEQFTVAITVLGTVAKGSMPLRSNAEAGDDIYVSGTIGDSALGLLLLEGRQGALSTQERDYLHQRYFLPVPRLELGQALVGSISASIDVSDGLLGDLEHVCKTSGLGARIREADIPLSPAAEKMLAGDDSLIERILTGGDDYELLFCAKPSKRAAIDRIGSVSGVPVARIGETAENNDIILIRPDGTETIPATKSFRHF